MFVINHANMIQDRMFDITCVNISMVCQYRTVILVYNV